MIYAPPCLEIDGAEGCSRSQTRIVSESIRGSTQEGNTGKAIDEHASITTKQSQASKIKKATGDNTLRYRIYSQAVTNRLSEVLVSHDNTSRLQWVKLFSYTS